MHKLAIAIVCAALTGCATMTPRQKQVAAVIGSALVVGAVAAHSGPKGPPDLDDMQYVKPCSLTPSGPIVTC